MISRCQFRVLSGMLLLLLCSSHFTLLAQGETGSPPDAGEKSGITGKRCPYCKTTGRIPNPFWEKHEHGAETVLFCSCAAETDKVGRGLPWFPCKRCKNKKLQAAAQAEFDAAVKAQEEWIAERRAIDKALKVTKPLLHLRTEHFAWAWDIPRFKGSDKKSYDSHAGLHLYADRMERLYRDWQRVHKITDKDNVCSLHSLYCFSKAAVSLKACPLYGHGASATGKNSRQGINSAYVNWWNKDLTPTDRDFHCEMIHNVTHLLIASYRNGWWLQENGVAYEGGAHWWEIYYCGRAGSHCHSGKRGLTGWTAEKWHVVVKNAVVGGTHPRIEDLLGASGSKLHLGHHPFAWSYIDFMMSVDPQKTLEFYLVLKRQLPAGEAIEEAFGMDIPAFERAWEQFVMKTYRLQGLSPTVPDRFRSGG
jgi:hypothetical protein